MKTNSAGVPLFRFEDVNTSVCRHEEMSSESEKIHLEELLTVLNANRAAVEQAIAVLERLAPSRAPREPTPRRLIQTPPPKRGRPPGTKKEPKTSTEAFA